MGHLQTMDCEDRAHAPKGGVIVEIPCVQAWSTHDFGTWFQRIQQHIAGIVTHMSGSHFTSQAVVSCISNRPQYDVGCFEAYVLDHSDLLRVARALLRQGVRGPPVGYRGACQLRFSMQQFQDASEQCSEQRSGFSRPRPPNLPSLKVLWAGFGGSILSVH